MTCRHITPRSSALSSVHTAANRRFGSHFANKKYNNDDGFHFYVQVKLPEDIGAGANASEDTGVDGVGANALGGTEVESESGDRVQIRRRISTMRLSISAMPVSV